MLTPILNNWVAYCLAVYLTKDYKLCMTIFETITALLGANPLESLKGNELNELYIFRTTLLEQVEGAKKALKFITKNKKYIVDETRYLEITIKLYLKNNQRGKALESVNELIKINPYNAEYYKLAFEANGYDMQNESEEKVLELIGQYEKLHKKSNTPSKVALDLLKAGPVFKERLAAYIRPQVIKGVSSLVNELRTLYQDSGKAKILGEVLGSMCDSMENEMSLSPEDEEEQDPTVQMWLYCFLSQHNLRLG